MLHVNFSLQLATQPLLRCKLQEKLFRVTWPLWRYKPTPWTKKRSHCQIMLILYVIRIYSSIHENSCLFFFFYFPVGNTTTVPFLLHPLVFVGYCTVFLASLFGNSVIIHIIRTHNSMRNTTNYLIINQACADLLISFAEITGVLFYSSSGGVWIGGILGLISCKMIS